MSARPRPTRRTLLLVTSALAIVFASVQPSLAVKLHGEHKADGKRQVELLEQQWRTAQLQSDLPTIDRLLADDYVGISLAGQITTKAQLMSRMRNHLFVISRLDMTEQKVKIVGEVAVVTVRAAVEGTSRGATVNGEFRYTRIYHRLPNGVWKITNFEATRIPSSRDGIVLAKNGKTG